MQFDLLAICTKNQGLSVVLSYELEKELNTYYPTVMGIGMTGHRVKMLRFEWPMVKGKFASESPRSTGCTLKLGNKRE